MNVSGRFLCALLMASLALLVPASVGPGEGTSAASAPSPALAAASGCGTQQIPKPGGGYWACSFADHFSGTALNTAKWARMVTAESGFKNGPECYLATGNSVRVANGALVLTVARTAASFRCDSPRGDYISQYTGGSISTYRKFSQTYGRFEIRARFPAVTVPGLHSAIWLWPQAQTYGSLWPSSGEIDVGEFYTTYPDRVIPAVHYLGDALDPNKLNNYCYVTRPQDFHTYRLTWTAQAIRIEYDGKLCLLNDNWRPLLQSKPQPFDHPFVINLTQSLGILLNAFRPNETPLPASMYVDYVRVWR
jgi:beta-glucanase (GH16 family)